MSRPSGYPRWADVSGVVTEPSEGEKDQGFVTSTPTVPRKAFAQIFNWLFELNYQWIKYMDETRPRGRYGTGSDGDFTLDGATTPAWASKTAIASGIAHYYAFRDVYAARLQVGTGSVLKMANKTYGSFALYCKDELITLHGRSGGYVDWSGDPAIGATAGAPAGDLGTLSGGGAGGNGNAGAGNQATGVNNAFQATGGWAWPGNKGGDGGSGGLGGAAPGGGALIVGASSVLKGVRDPISGEMPMGYVQAIMAAAVGPRTLQILGGGGGGGGGGGNGFGGGGGAGAAHAALAARKITLGTNTDLRAWGGDGGPAIGSSAAGGGGGAGGGFQLAYEQANQAFSAAVNCAPGRGGLGNGPATSQGQTGSPGKLYEYPAF